MNVPDHDMTFQSLSELLQQSVSPFVASVQAKECGGKGLIVFALKTQRNVSLSVFLELYIHFMSLYCLLYHFSIEAFDEEGPGEVDGHCCDYG